MKNLRVNSAKDLLKRDPSASQAQPQDDILMEGSEVIRIETISSLRLSS